MCMAQSRAITTPPGSANSWARRDIDVPILALDDDIAEVEPPRQDAHRRCPHSNGSSSACAFLVRLERTSLYDAASLCRSSSSDVPQGRFTHERCK